MYTTEQTLELLNSHTGENIWDELIIPVLDYDDDLTEAVFPTESVHESTLSWVSSDGTIYYYDFMAHEWLDRPSEAKWFLQNAEELIVESTGDVWTALDNESAWPEDENGRLVFSDGSWLMPEQVQHLP